MLFVLKKPSDSSKDANPTTKDMFPRGSLIEGELQTEDVTNPADLHHIRLFVFGLVFCLASAVPTMNVENPYISGKQFFSLK